jgi:TIGR00251 family protein
VSILVVTQTEDGVRFSVHVQPRASKTEVAGVHGAALKVRLHSPPVDGAANEELVSFLAKSLDVPKRSVRIVSGLSARKKTVEIDGISPASVRALAEAKGIK